MTGGSGGVGVRRGTLDLTGLGDSMAAEPNGRTDRAPHDRAPLADLDAEERARLMVADPLGYFTRARAESRVEAKQYVAKRLGRAKTA